MSSKVTSSNLISKLRKFKIHYDNKINTIEHNINSPDGIINTGTINVNQGGYIYNVDEDNNYAIVNKEYVDTHGGGIDKTKPLHLQGIPSLTTTGNIIAGYNSLDETQNKLIIEATNGNVITQGKITANSIEILNGTIENVNETDNSIINRKYYYDNMQGVDPSTTLHLQGTPSLTTTGDVIIGYDSAEPLNNKISIEGNTGNISTTGNINANNLQIVNGYITTEPSENTSIVNKEYVDTQCLLTNNENEQNITGPINLENDVKIYKLLMPINS